MIGRRCAQCDTQLEEGAAFCGSCGSPVEKGGKQRSKDSAADEKVSHKRKASKRKELYYSSRQPTADEKEPDPSKSTAVKKQATPATGQPHSEDDGSSDEGVQQESRSPAHRTRRWSVLQVVELVAAITTAFAIGIGAIKYIAEADSRHQQTVDEAWQVITAAESQPVDGGKSTALEFLNEGGQTSWNAVVNAFLNVFSNEECQTPSIEESQNLTGVNVKGAFLENLDLEDATLNWANFQEAKLDGANLRCADLWRANLRAAYLGPSYDEEGYLVRNANLNNAFLDEADLRDTFLGHASLRDAELRYANLELAWLNKADLTGRAKLGGANLQQASLRGANLQGASLGHANLEDADIRGADLRGTKNLYTEQLEVAIGDQSTQLPEHVQRPLSWEQGTEIRLSATPQERPLKPQKYTSRAFAPAMQFTVDGNWHAMSDLVDNTVLYHDATEDEAQLGFINVQQVFDPNNPTYNPSRASLDNMLPPPDDLVTWLRKHPYLDTPGLDPDEEPAKKSIDGVSAVQLDIVASSTPTNYPRNCPRPCVPLFRDSRGGWTAVYEGYTGRIYVLDVGGEAVVFLIDGPADEFEGFLSEAENVVETVRWVETVEVPELSGISYEEATDQVGEDFEIEPTYRFSGEPEGRILNQKLLPGESATQGSELPLTISRGPEPGVAYETVRDESGTLIEIGVDEGWTSRIDPPKEGRVGMTAEAPDETANVIVSSELIDSSYDARRYADEQYEPLQQDFPKYRQLTYKTASVFGVTGFERVFEWDPADNQPVTQIQLYYAEDGQGYVATATTLSSDFEEYEPRLREMLNKITLIR